MLIIAELGTSHNGNIYKAREMVNAAAEAGANCIKLQMVFADEILHPNTGEVELPGGKIRLYDRFKQLEMPFDFFSQLKEYIESLGLLFLCTPFGLKSAKLLRELQPKMVKIASPELNFTALLKEISAWNLPVLLSTGVSTLGDIEEALNILNLNVLFSPLCASAPLRKEIENNICLLHCITAYPAPETEYNLRVLKNLSGIFGLSVGVSDHSLDPVLVPVLAVSQGASVIEKHFCLSREDSGLDDPIALPPADFTRMVKALRTAEKSNPEEIILSMQKEYGTEKVEAVLGSGIKFLAPSEKENYTRTNRSIHALRDIHPGEIINVEDFTILRTEKILRPGISPSWADKLAGRKAQNFIPAGEGIRFEDI